MDEGRASYQMMAPGAGSAARSYDLPGADTSPPRVDDYRTDIDFESQEMIGGEVFDVMGSDLPHAQRNGQLDYLLRGLAAPGYVSATDLKTRFAEEDDFASDSALVRDGIDPRTGTRHLEEIAFEVVSEQSPAIAARKAPRMIRRGVRRVFAVFVKKEQVAEWSAEEGGWTTLHPSSVIEDPILAEPLEVAAILDAARADDAVVRGLAKKNNPEIQRIREKERRESRIETLQRAVLSLLEVRGLDVAPSVRDAVLACSDADVLERWHRAAVTVPTASQILDA